jgi:ABC-type uncharacterized transport system substrate-binding protein
MKRRELIAGIGGAATSFLWPRAMRAQQPQKQRIAFVHSGIPADQLTETAGPFWVRRFYETLRGLGHTEGANLVVERYSAEGGSDRFAALAAAVVSSKPDVIVSNHNDLVKAFAAATATVPIVGITGSAGLAFREAGQHLGIALIVNFLPYVGEAQSAHRALVVELAGKHRLPVIYPYRDYVDLGGLMAYAPDLGELAQRLADDVHQILNGTKTGDIPFYQPNKFQLTINLKAAKALGLELPSTLVVRADEVIE